MEREEMLTRIKRRVYSIIKTCSTLSGPEYRELNLLPRAKAIEEGARRVLHKIVSRF